MSESGEREKGETTAKTTAGPLDRAGDTSRVGDSELTLPRVPTSALIAKALLSSPPPKLPFTAPPPMAMHPAFLPSPLPPPPSASSVTPSLPPPPPTSSMPPSLTPAIPQAPKAPPVPQYPPSVQLATGVSGTIPAPVRQGSETVASQTGIELGRPLYAVGALAVLLSLVTLAVAGQTVAYGVAVGGAIATMNLWSFTKLGTALLAKRGIHASWGVLASLKLVALFGGVVIVLRTEIAGPIPFVIGYLVLPVGIVLSQFFGLRPEGENGDNSG